MKALSFLTVDLSVIWRKGLKNLYRDVKSASRLRDLRAKPRKFSDLDKVKRLDHLFLKYGSLTELLKILRLRCIAKFLACGLVTIARIAGIEPTQAVLKTTVLPLNYIPGVFAKS